jgi:hypothetical protein
MSGHRPNGLENESSWLRRQVINLRTALRFAKDARTQVLIREAIEAAENRLIAIEKNASCLSN